MADFLAFTLSHSLTLSLSLSKRLLKYKKKQQALQEIIDKHTKQYETEKEVSVAVTSHLEVKTAEINALRKQRDEQKDAKQALLEEERDNIMNQKTEARQQYE